MLIKYTGEKPKKTLQLNHKTYEFIPTCEVVDKEALKFLLNDERIGLFEEVKSPPPSMPAPEIASPKPNMADNSPSVKSKKHKKDK